MTYDEQLKRLEDIIERIRLLQESGLWEPLHNTKVDLYKLHADITKQQEVYQTKVDGFKIK